jgi:hypothetical protein
MFRHFRAATAAGAEALYAAAPKSVVEYLSISTEQKILFWEDRKNGVPPGIFLNLVERVMRFTRI